MVTSYAFFVIKKTESSPVAASGTVSFVFVQVTKFNMKRKRMCIPEKGIKGLVLQKQLLWYLQLKVAVFKVRVKTFCKRTKKLVQVKMTLLDALFKTQQSQVQLSTDLISQIKLTVYFTYRTHNLFNS